MVQFGCDRTAANNNINNQGSISIFDILNNDFTSEELSLYLYEVEIFFQIALSQLPEIYSYTRNVIQSLLKPEVEIYTELCHLGYDSDKIMNSRWNELLKEFSKTLAQPFYDSLESADHSIKDVIVSFENMTLSIEREKVLWQD
ncbi:MAG: hypothetical protein KAG61_06765 [Bacteriovoracaceae bacterium]|nr:hypothetical protein [Bacteriovoracaceae bacterium]